MKNVIAFPEQRPTPQADREEVATYGRVGDLAVDFVRLPTIMIAQPL